MIAALGPTIVQFHAKGVGASLAGPKGVESNTQSHAMPAFAARTVGEKDE